MSAFGGVPLNMDPVSGDVYDDEPVDAERLAHLEAMLDRASGALADQARLIRDQKVERDQLRSQLERATDIAVEKAVRVTELENELAGARVIIEARDSRVVQLETEARQAREAADDQHEQTAELADKLREIQRVLDRA
jgi:chromosome segregation ATPase